MRRICLRIRNKYLHSAWCLVFVWWGGVDGWCARVLFGVSNIIAGIPDASQTHAHNTKPTKPTARERDRFVMICLPNVCAGRSRTIGEYMATLSPSSSSTSPPSSSPFEAEHFGLARAKQYTKRITKHGPERRRRRSLCSPRVCFSSAQAF